MKFICLTTLLCLSLTTFSQSYSWERPKGSYGFVFGTELGMRQLIPNESYVQPAYQRLPFIRDSERSISSFVIGFNYSRYLGKDYYIKTGLRISNPGYYSKLNSLNFEDKIALTEREDIQNNKSYNYRYFFLEIPLQLRYVYDGRNCRSFVEMGLNTQVYLGTQLTLASTNTELIKVREDVFPLNFLAKIGIGAEYDLTRKLPVFVQLVCHYQINAIDKGPALERSFGLGFETGTRYYF